MEKRDLESQGSLRQSYDAKLTELNELIATADNCQQQQGSQDLQDYMKKILHKLQS